MQNPNRLWFLLNWQAWAVLLKSPLNQGINFGVIQKSEGFYRITSFVNTEGRILCRRE